MPVIATNLQQAAALLKGMSVAELYTLQELTAKELEEHSRPFPFLALSAELRNEIYDLVAVSQVFSITDIERQENGLAVVNKQISSEYLSVLNSKEMVRAKYLRDVTTMGWEDIDVRKLLTARSIFAHEFPEDQDMWFRSFHSSGYASAEKKVVDKTRLDDAHLAKSGDPAQCSFWGMLEIAGSSEGYFVFAIKVKEIDNYCPDAQQRDNDDEV
ncbi:hypothetical protein CB0940_02481 [Cercospora beticola]|uniref:Uncharacterized protein n=1 Tax=Cercospora beticola TaxID=122368 RepID=A0A2G5I2G8_CERBT|nr:hypothetical protein CB0940_02481 [Cercospora beticola]PIA98996.1 hypothetical protein CB0940_02481 [Cercospora beticola]WPA99616.1 hypothetical protein RHO25_004234 [Cercospora beticola]CAK1362242.1 unnamed protein product [Cercospora beticola]